MRIISRLFRECLSAEYLHVGGASCAFLLEEGKLTVFFEESNGIEDWIQNLDFPAEAYRDMYVHGGFLESFQKLLPLLEKELINPQISAVTLVGYSHGGALATLCHEYIYSEYPTLRPQLQSVVFGAPRVLHESITEAVFERFDRLLRVENIGDIVTLLPPNALGFRHVGHRFPIGRAGKYGPFSAHRAENYLLELEMKDF